LRLPRASAVITSCVKRRESTVPSPMSADKRSGRTAIDIGGADADSPVIREVIHRPIVGTRANAKRAADQTRTRREVGGDHTVRIATFPSASMTTRYASTGFAMFLTSGHTGPRR